MRALRHNLLGDNAMHNSTETIRVHLDGVDHASRGMAQRQSSADVASLSSVGCLALHPTVKITPAKQVKRLGTGWHWWFSESVHVPTSSKTEFRFQGPTHLLALYNEGLRRNGETSIDGLHSSSLRSFVGKLTFVPAGCRYRERYETSASARLTFLYFDPAAFQKSYGSGGALLPRIHFEDHLVWETACKLKIAIESAQAKCMPYLEALSGVLLYELSSVEQAALRQSVVSRGGLAGWQKRTIGNYIEEHLEEQVSLLKLAELAQLSLHHFCRAFKQSFGTPPHQYQVQRRMDVAKVRLADRNTSVTDIAFSLGYAQVGSFSAAFRKTTGWTPRVYRREFN
jgi:AraC family transcriptional regulator